MITPTHPEDWIHNEIRFSHSRSILVIGSASHALDRRSSRLLSVLVQHFGDTVGKDELMAAAWPGRTVLENSLVKAMAKLRGTLKGSGIEIATVHGYGYILRDHHCEASRDEIAQPPPPTMRRLGTITMLIVLVGLGALGVAVLQEPARNVIPLRSSPPQTIDGPNARGIVLWVDDNPANNILDVEFLRANKVAVHLAKSTDEALDLLAFKNYDLVISDLGRGEDRLAGLTLIGAMKAGRHDVPVLIYTMRPDDAHKQLALNALVFDRGARALALTPAEVRLKALRLLGISTR